MLHKKVWNTKGAVSVIMVYYIMAAETIKHIIVIKEINMVHYRQVFIGSGLSDTCVCLVIQSNHSLQAFRKGP